MYITLNNFSQITRIKQINEYKDLFLSILNVSKIYTNKAWK